MSLTTSLISWWDLEEASGSRSDAHGSNPLTDNNTVTNTTGVVGNAAQFIHANSEYLSHASNSDFQTGDIDFTWAFWVNFTIGSGAGFIQPIISKHGGSGAVEYVCYYDDSSDKVQWAVSNDGTATTFLTTFTPADNTSYFVVIEHDSVNDLITLEVNNNGTPYSTAHSGGIYVGSADFEMGGLLNALFFGGFIDSVAFWKRLLTSGEKSTLYNAGAGVSYADISGGGGGVTATLYFNKFIAGHP